MESSNVKPPAASGSSADVELASGEPNLTGRVIADYRLVRRLGKGGMGQVYLAEQVSLKRRVALKIMKPEAGADPTSLKRFQAEAEAVARVTHANIVQVYQVSQAEGYHFMALEYVEGHNLRDYLARKGPPELPLALSIMGQVAKALDRAAELGVVHRDIKPENVLINKKGEVKVADFGLSLCFGPEKASMRLTQTGVSMGTPMYMSPEQVEGGKVDPRTDIYSFGATCYHMLTGEPPFKGKTAYEVAMQHVQKEPVPIHELRPDLPADLCDLVRRMMAKKPDDRPQSARELLRELSRIHERAGHLPAGSRSSGSFPIVMPGPITTGIAIPPIRNQSRKVWIVLAFVLSVILAGGLGAALRLVVGNDRPLLPETPRAIEPVLPQKSALRERALQEAVKESFDVKDLDDRKKHLDAAIDLGILYLQQRKLKEAKEYFTGLVDKPPQDQSVYKALGKLGLAAVNAYQDQPNDAARLFKEVADKATIPSEKMKQPGEERTAQLNRLLKDHPEYVLLQVPKARRFVSEALNALAATQPNKTLADPVLENLRKVPQGKKSAS